MIGWLAGQCLFKIEEDHYLIKVGQVGYNVRTYRSLAIDEKVEFFIYEVIREDNFELYGFPDQDRLKVFKNLLAISGVGPKIALAILKKASSQDLEKAISDSDVSFFQSIPGIGLKLAQKVILELKSKLGQETNLDSLSSDRFSDLRETLKTLGYKTKEFESWLAKIPSENNTLQKQVTWVLRQLSTLPPSERSG